MSRVPESFHQHPSWLDHPELTGDAGSPTDQELMREIAGIIRNNPQISNEQLRKQMGMSPIVFEKLLGITTN